MFKTERLEMRMVVVADAPFFLKLVNEPSYIHMIRDSGVRDEESAQTLIQQFYLNSYDKNGFGLYVIVLSGCKTPIGISGFVQREGLPFPDLGFAILSQYEGKGYVFEASKAVLDFGKTTLKFKTVAAMTTEKNVRSVALLQKLGFSFVKMMRIPSIDKDLIYYEKSL